MKNVLIAMSGGVDSAVAALLLKNQGYSVGGVTMKVWSDKKDVSDSDKTPDGNCLDAMKIAELLGFEHHIVSFGEIFRRNVVNKFLKDYANGSTPNPCVECNKTIKFGALYDCAAALGYDAFATGHYARIEKNANGDFLLRKAKDENKDQTYFLWAIKKEILPSVLFPLGEYSKAQIRELAFENGFFNADRSDSQDICFIKDGDYAKFITERSSKKFNQGDFVDIHGNVLGKHSGIINYTIGQRKGLGIAFGVPMFVGGKDAYKNTVTLCSDAQLYKDTLTASDINILVDESFEKPLRLQAKIRYRHSPATATVVKTDTDTLSVKFDLPQRAIAPGQSLVLYDGDTVVGGGIIR